jgi:methionine-rich copper-binding protein CopC
MPRTSQQSNTYSRPDDQKSIVRPLQGIASGMYSVKYQILSVDCQVVEPTFDFTVKDDSLKK